MPPATIEPFYSSWWALAALSLGVVTLLGGAGHVALRLLPALRIAPAAPARHAESLLVGVFGFSLLGFGGVLARVPLVVTFAALALATAAAALVLARRRTTETVASADPAPRAAGWGALALIAAGSLVWSITNLRGLEASADTVRLVPWIDVLFHARQISNFAHFDGDTGALHWSMYGEPMAAYHYGSYVVAALVMALGGASSLQVATSVYPVLGMALSGAAMLVLAQSTLGWRAALVALGLLFFLPDISSAVPGLTRQSSYFFFQQVGVGGAFATALLGLALAAALRAHASGARVLSYWALGLLLACALFKIQIVLAYGAAFALVVVALAPVSRRLRLLGAAATIGLTALALQTLAAMPNAPTLAVSLAGVRKLFALGPPDATPLIAQLALLPVGAVGVWLLAYGVLLPLALGLAWRGRAEPSLRLPIALLLVFMLANAAVRLLIDDNQGYGDATEINRKTFVLPYFVVVYATAALVWHEVSRWPAARWQRRRPVWQAAGALMVVASVAAAWRLQVWPGQSDRFTSTVVKPELLASAAHLRRHSGPGDVVQLCENDPMVTLGTLAERPVYVAKFVINPINTPPPNAAERERLARLEAIDRAPDLDRARQLAQQTSIDWFVLTPGCRPQWERAVESVRSDGDWRLIAFDHRFGR